jgi:hypothetical protein
VATAVPIFQLIAYVMLTLASITVAALSAFLAYRNNFGWKPLAIVTSHGLTGTGGSNTWDATLQFEIWNRRKYPISIRQIRVALKNLPFRGDPYETTDPKEQWFRSGDTYYTKSPSTLAPAAQEIHSLVIPIVKGTSLDNLVATALITVEYFDPIVKRRRPLRINYTLEYK